MCKKSELKIYLKYFENVIFDLETIEIILRVLIIPALYASSLYLTKNRPVSIQTAKQLTLIGNETVKIVEQLSEDIKKQIR
jgi:hypothetical protein